MAVVDPDLVLMTHFARSDEFGERATPAQIACFESACQGIAGTRSLANSAAVLGWPDAHADWVRPGGAFYGISVVEGGSGADSSERRRVGKEVVMTGRAGGGPRN